MNFSKDKIFSIAEAATALIGIIIALAGSNFGIFLAAVGFLGAIIDLLMYMKKEGLSFQELISVGIKEKTISFIVVFVCLIFGFFTPEIWVSNEYDKAVSEISKYY